ncbi:MAG: PIN domain-containing protein [Nanoarchaeota archaeon]
MGTVAPYFFDTYAFFELIRGNKNYDPYRKEVTILTTRLNLMELYYGLLLRKGKIVAEAYYDRFLPYVVEPSDDIIKKASQLKAFFKTKRLSYIDCVGYMLARYNRIPFLTGDQGFKDMEGVRFVR